MRNILIPVGDKGEKDREPKDSDKKTPGVVKHVVLADAPVKAFGPGLAAGPANPVTPWQSKHGRKPVNSHKQVATAEALKFERETGHLEHLQELLGG